MAINDVHVRHTHMLATGHVVVISVNCQLNILIIFAENCSLKQAAA